MVVNKVFTIQVGTVFKETIYQLRDVLITQHAMAFTAPSTNPGYSSKLPSSKRSSLTPTNTTNTTGQETSGKSSAITVPNTTRCVSPNKQLQGGSLQNVDQISAKIDDFSTRVTQVVDVVATLTQFHQLLTKLRGLPRVTGLWTMANAEGTGSLEMDNEGDIPVAGAIVVSNYVEQVFSQKGYPLPPPVEVVITCEEEEEEDTSSDSLSENLQAHVHVCIYIVCPIHITCICLYVYTLHECTYIHVYMYNYDLHVHVVCPMRRYMYMYMYMYNVYIHAYVHVCATLQVYMCMYMYVLCACSLVALISFSH